jgi:hypothetical protein
MMCGLAQGKVIESFTARVTISDSNSMGQLVLGDGAHLVPLVLEELAVRIGDRVRRIDSTRRIPRQVSAPASAGGRRPRR